MPQADSRISPRTPWERAYPEALRKKDEAAIIERRTAAGAVNATSAYPIGLALSGGGIRSATFSLGVLQAMAKANLLGKIDYLSTVSGGGYIGSFLGALFTRTKRDPQKTEVEKVESTLTNNGSDPINWLRENGRYLSPNGAGDLLLAGAVGLRNWAAIQFVLGTLVVTLFLMVESARYVATDLQLIIPGGGFRAVLTLLLAAGVLPLAWSYWLAQSWKGRFRDGWPMPPLLVGVATLVVSLIRVSGGFRDKPTLLLFAVSGLALAYAGIARLWALHKKLAAVPRDLSNLLSRWLKGALVLTGGILVFAVVDRLGVQLYDLFKCGDLVVVLAKYKTLSTTAGALLVFGRKIASSLASSSSGKRRLRLPLSLLAGAAALLLAAGVLISLSAVAHGFADGWNGSLPDGVLSATAVGIVLTLILGRTFPFLNQSSLQALYAARLTRAYLGASNSERWDPDSGNLTDLMPHDGLTMADYKPHKNGGPLHLINVTLNETVSGKSQIEQRDRKGLGMALGPNAFSVGGRHHLLMPGHTPAQTLVQGLSEDEKNDFWIFPTLETPDPEQLDLGTWISISGAAFTTGLGSRTSLGLSLLCGFFNVRLGYWWNSEIAPRSRPQRSSPAFLGRIYSGLTGVLPVHMHLLDEFLARFPGPASMRWYLSDGGHFENTACYELIRRRLPLIILCDDGADPEYNFADLANLVRKARTDFCTEITFLDDPAIWKRFSPDLAKLFGPLDELRPHQPGRRTARNAVPAPPDEQRFSRKHCAVAHIDYPGGEEGLLLVLKPTLTGDEPADLIEYHSSHPAFPQEPTSQQFFDEAQWESYRKLGETVGRKVFPALGPTLLTRSSNPAGPRQGPGGSSAP